MAKALVPTPNTGGQHWDRFHVLGRVDHLIVHDHWYKQKEYNPQNIYVFENYPGYIIRHRLHYIVPFSSGYNIRWRCDRT